MSQGTVYPSSKDILKAGEGRLEAMAFPLVLHAISVEERTCTLELKLRNLEKRIVFEEGAPVDCSSNLLHETLGKYLVSKGKLTEEQYRAALADSVATNKPLGGLLVEKQLVPPFELFKHLQASLAHKILDVFRWHDATWRLLPGEAVSTPIRINAAQLVFTGCGQLTDEQVLALWSVPDAEGLQVASDGRTEGQELKLSAKDSRLVQKLKTKATVPELMAALSLERPALLRRLVPLVILGRVDLASRVQARPNPPPPSSPGAVAAVADAAAVAPPPGLPFFDDDEKVKNLLAGELLSYRDKDPFDVLGVPVTVQSVALQKAYLAKAAALSPVRFRSDDLRQKAEGLALAYARAYGTLCDPEGVALHRRRREVLAEQQAETKRRSAAEHFRIRTDLLDADTQFAEGYKRLNAGNFKGAVEYFEYACDIEPKAQFRAYLARARCQLDPQRNAAKALVELSEACAAEPECEEAWAFRADIALGLGQTELADECYRKAIKLNPGQKRYTEQLKVVARSRKG